MLGFALVRRWRLTSAKAWMGDRRSFPLAAAAFYGRHLIHDINASVRAG
jgi:hypothetical protein